MSQEKNKHAQALGRLRAGVEEKPSAKKRKAVRANLEAARRAWQAMTPEERRRVPA